MSPTRRILQVCPYDWHAPGGVQMHVRRLTEALRVRGHDVLVLAPGRHGALEPWVRIVGRPTCVSFNGSVAPISPNPHAALEIRRVLRTYSPELVHVHEPIAPSLGLFAALLSPVPVVGTFHAHCVTRIGRVCYAVATWPFNWRLAAGIAVSHAATASLGRGVRVPFRIVPNGVDSAFLAIDRPQVSARPRRLLFAHRLEPRKGLGVAVAAFARLASQFADLELVVVGDGVTERVLETLPGSARARLRLRGTLSRADLVAEFAAADVFVAPALGGESFGIVLLEAMAAGLPVVASRVSGYREVVHDETEGLLVTPGDARALEAAIARILLSPNLAARLGHAGRKRARRYGWERIAEEVERTYDEVLPRTDHPDRRIAV